MSSETNCSRPEPRKPIDIFPSNYHVIDNIVELKRCLSEVFVRFDTDPSYYLKADYKVLLRTIAQAFLYLYKKDESVLTRIICEDRSILSSTGEFGVIYFIPKLDTDPSKSDDNKYDEYAYIIDAWEFIGDKGGASSTLSIVDDNKWVEVTYNSEKNQYTIGLSEASIILLTLVLTNKNDIATLQSLAAALRTDVDSLKQLVQANTKDIADLGSRTLWVRLKQDDGTYIEHQIFLDSENRYVIPLEASAYVEEWNPLGIKRTIRFLNDDGSVLQTQSLLEGVTPVAPEVPAKEGYEFAGWNPAIVPVIGDQDYTAVYNKLSYSITAVASPEEGGTIEGGGTYEYGTEVTLTATANEGYKFVNWSDGDTNATRTITATEDATYTAVYEKLNTSTINIKWTIDPTPTYTPAAIEVIALNYIDESGNKEFIGNLQTVYESEKSFVVDSTRKVEFSATKNDYTRCSYYYSSINGVVTKDNTVTLDVSSDNTIIVHYVPVTHTLTWSGIDSETTIANEEVYTKSGSVYCGASIVAPILEKEGCNISWDQEVPSVMPNSDLTITAVYEGTNTLTISVVGPEDKYDRDIYYTNPTESEDDLNANIKTGNSIIVTYPNNRLIRVYGYYASDLSSVTLDGVEMGTDWFVNKTSFNMNSSDHVMVITIN